jgi:hypothetical protein
LLQSGFEFRMFKPVLFLALGFFAVCFPLVAQQAKHSGPVQHRVAASALVPLDTVSNFSIYRPNVLSASNSILFHSGPVRAWSDGAQLVSGNALMQIGMAPLGLFPVTYFAPSDIGPAPMAKPAAGSTSRQRIAATDGKDLPGEMISSPLNQVYCTGEVGFVYGRWSGKGNGDYWQNYVSGQVGNDHFQINAGASFENWSGNSPKVRGYSFSR